LSEREFLARVRRGDFLEHVEYVSGYRYGTLRTEVDRILGRGKSCVLELETKGARAVRHAIPESVTIFVAAPSSEELERRLRERATESAGEIEERLELARRQTREQSEFDYTIVNDDLERALTELTALLDDPRRAAPTTAVGREPG
jgi:guanylate kinase